MSKQRKSLRPGLWFLILAMVAVSWGLLHSEARLVMLKGATICLECMGLG